MARSINPTEQQKRHLRDQVARTMLDAPRVNKRRGQGGNVYPGGATSPQRFADHPRIQLPSPNGNGLINYPISQSGEVAMVSWDGEGTAAAPAITKAV